jgi:hypothetical protein
MRSKRLSLEESYQKVVECRKSGLTDRQWCIENQIPSSTFYTWIKRLRMKSVFDLPESIAKNPEKRNVHHNMMLSKSISCALPTEAPFPLSNHTCSDLNHRSIAAEHAVTEYRLEDVPIEIQFQHMNIRIRNSADPVLFSNTLKVLKGILCQGIFPVLITFSLCSLGGVQENNTQESYGDVSSETEETEFSANPSERETTELASSQDNGQLETEDSIYSNEDTGNKSVDNQPQEKSITGVYTLELGNEGGAELEITYSSGDDSFLVYFSGSYGDQAGETKGYLVAHTDGTDGIWEYYEYSAYEAGNYIPSMQLEYDAADTITVTSLDGQSFGGMDFPGFGGTYVRTAEYSMP